MCRSSKLTHVLKNSLGGNCRTVLVANVWSDAAQTDETLSTCRFAQRMMRVTCEVSANVVQDSSARVRQLERCVCACMRFRPQVVRRLFYGLLPVCEPPVAPGTPGHGCSCRQVAM